MIFDEQVLIDPLREEKKLNDQYKEARRGRDRASMLTYKAALTHLYISTLVNILKCPPSPIQFQLNII